jgi:hypothetical protein
MGSRRIVVIGLAAWGVAAGGAGGGLSAPFQWRIEEVRSTRARLATLPGPTWRGSS